MTVAVVFPMQHPVPADRFRWRVTGFLALAALINYADRSALSSVLPALREEMGLTDVQLGLLGSVFLWSYALGSPAAGLVADRFSRSRVVVVSLVSWSLITLAVGLATNFAALAVLRIGLGLAECLYIPAAIALLAAHHGPATRGRAMSLHSIGLNAGVIAGGAFAGFAAEAWGWRTGFYLLGAAGVVLALGARRFLRDRPESAEAAPPARRAPAREALAYLVRTPSYYVMFAKAALSGVTIWIFLAWLPLYFRERFNLGLGQAGFLGTFMLQIATVIGIALGGWVSDRMAANAPARRMLVQSAAYFLAAPFLLIFLFGPGFVAAVTAVTCFSLLRGLGSASEQPTVCEIVPPAYRSTAIGVMNMGATAAGGGGVLLAGLLKGAVGLEGVFAGSAAIFATAALGLFVGYRFLMPADVRRAQIAERPAAAA